MDLEPFSRINPCGYPGMAVTQLGNLAAVGDEAGVAHRLVDKLAGQLGLVGVWASDGPSRGD
jgi:lipoyl(octanoyl) transferase